MNSVPFSDITLKNGFWSDKQQLNRETVLWAVYNRFKETGRIDSMDCQTYYEDLSIAWGSDVFKWIEGAAYVYRLHPDEKIISAIRNIVNDVKDGTREDGYYNSYFNNPRITKPRFTDRNAHELYSLGHMIEAGIAVYETFGDDTLLNLCKRGADLVYRIFFKENSAAFVTPGHEEIELALVRLYRATQEQRYLELAEFFVRQRGNNVKDQPIRSDFVEVDQSHLPITQQTTAEGHAVRAVYLYCAIADLAKDLQDDSLFQTAETLFSDIYEHKAYITGGIGSTNDGEAFIRPYYLPNATAYTETCAALGLALFCRRMYALKPDGRYGDLAERALYNGMLSGLSLDGTSFFYTNPLEIDLDRQGVRGIPARITQRKKVFGCSCCPPNLVRLLPSLADFLYTYDDRYLYVHQYMANVGTVDGCHIEVKTAYPQDGGVAVAYNGNRNVALRRPAWCQEIKADAVYVEKDGYLYFDSSAVSVEFVMQPLFYQASTHVHENVGKVALMRGPIVYCLEEHDQLYPLASLRVNPASAVTVCKESFGGLPKLQTDGIAVSQSTPLYHPVCDEHTACPLTFIPYYAFANRSESAMKVWIDRL
ncbi:MAG: glycoside hydrolase family 127 protein [Clostridia bacterium]|nr:glycoside hydrolase family 127 protein [Clostridia bacterium]